MTAMTGDKGAEYFGTIRVKNCVKLFHEIFSEKMNFSNYKRLFETSFDISDIEGNVS
jgi:hypothetical protein